MKQWLNAQLNQVSMYRLLSITLSVMWAVAILLAVLDILPFSPLAMIGSGIVLILASYLSNRLFGLLFGVRTHDESTYITALLLFFIFSPSLDVAAIASLALAATIASASKYLLAVRGRHVFNPAAIAALIISLAGLASASWWVATPALMSITLLFAFLILYKTRRLALGGVFLAVAVPLILANYLSNDQTLSEAILALPSWPLSFLVGFMLSEPLTLPPRQWQQLTVAAIVATAFAVPFSIGELSSSPALALVVGNIAAYLLARRRSITLSYCDTKALTPTANEYIFAAHNPIHFAPGQYLEVTIPHTHKDGRGLRRVFSIVSPPGDKTIRFGIKIYDRPSSFKRTLLTMKKGDTITATGIGGDFVLPKDANTPILFAAGGIGITPFISHLLYLQRQNQSRDITLIYAVNDRSEIAYIEEIKASRIHVVIVTKSDQPLPVPAWTHHNQPRINLEDITRYIPDVASRHAYISGPPAMVDAMKHLLKQSGVRRIKTDYFTGY